MAEEKMIQDDHDILIELRTVFREFRQEQSGNWARIHERLTKVFDLVDQKADKSDFDILKNNHKILKSEVKKLQDYNLQNNGLKNGVKQTASLVLKIWGIVSGIIFLIIAIYGSLFNL